MCLASSCIPTRDRADFIDTRDFEVVGKELDLRYLRHTGTSRARNAAIRASRGELLILCDDELVTTAMLRDEQFRLAVAQVL